MGEDHTNEPQANQRLTVAQAADNLGITEGAVRSRIKRGTLRTEKEGGTVYVVLGGGTAQANQPTNNDEPTDEPGVPSVVSLLREQIADLKGERDAWREQAQRSDHLLFETLERTRELERRLRELEAPASPEERGSPEGASDRSDRGTAPEEPQEGTEGRRPWWRRVFGG